MNQPVRSREDVWQMMSGEIKFGPKWASVLQTLSKWVAMTIVSAQIPFWRQIIVYASSFAIRPPWVALIGPLRTLWASLCLDVFNNICPRHRNQRAYRRRQWGTVPCSPNTFELPVKPQANDIPNPWQSRLNSDVAALHGEYTSLFHNVIYAPEYVHSFWYFFHF